MKKTITALITTALLFAGCSYDMPVDTNSKDALLGLESVDKKEDQQPSLSYGADAGFTIDYAYKDVDSKLKDDLLRGEIKYNPLDYNTIYTIEELDDFLSEHAVIDTTISEKYNEDFFANNALVVYFKIYEGGLEDVTENYMTEKDGVIVFHVNQFYTVNENMRVYFFFFGIEKEKAVNNRFDYYSRSYSADQYVDFKIKYVKDTSNDNLNNIPLRVIKNKNEFESFTGNKTEGFSIEEYDEGFFDNKMLVVITKGSAGDTITDRVSKCIDNYNTLSINLVSVAPTEENENMCFWTIFVELDKERVAEKDIMLIVNTIYETYPVISSYTIRNNSANNDSTNEKGTIPEEAYNIAEESWKISFLYEQKYSFLYVHTSEEEFLSNIDIENSDAEVYSRYNTEFFSKKDIVVIRTTEGSGSVDVNIRNITYNDSAYMISVNRSSPEYGTDDIRVWTFIIEIDKEYTQGRDAVVEINPIKVIKYE